MLNFVREIAQISISTIRMLEQDLPAVSLVGRFGGGGIFPILWTFRGA